MIASNVRSRGLLLDTHIFYWWQTNNPRLLSAPICEAFSRRQVFVSAASAWEVAIKASLGKITFPGSFEEAVDCNGFLKLPVTFAHAQAVEYLPHHHHDPFDRLLVAQALVEELTLVTADRQVAAYHCDALQI
jgi:PIN domain nuclease of toxin-antitoxin system